MSKKTNQIGVIRKAVSLLTLLLGTAASVGAQTNFSASLVPLGPDNNFIPGSAAFELDGPSVNFAISLGYEL